MPRPSKRRKIDEDGDGNNTSMNVSINTLDVPPTITPKRGRGRPRKVVVHPSPVEQTNGEDVQQQQDAGLRDGNRDAGADVSRSITLKRGRGRPRKVVTEPITVAQTNVEEMQQQVDAGLRHADPKATAHAKRAPSSGEAPVLNRTENENIGRTPGCKRGRPRKTTTPAIRLSDLMRPPENDVPSRDKTVSLGTSTRQSERERRERREPTSYSPKTSPVEGKGLSHGSESKKRKVGGPRKTVMFEDDAISQIAEQLGFKDVPIDGRSESVADFNGDGHALTDGHEVNSNEPNLQKGKRARPREDEVTEADSPPGLEGRRGIGHSTTSLPQHESINVEQEKQGRETLLSYITNDPEADKVVSSIKKIVLEKLAGTRSVPLIGFEEEYRKVHQVVSQTVLAGEGNSLLVIGARGSGKSTVLSPPSECASVLMTWKSETADRIEM